jgi:hypothetical protein
MCLTNGPSAPKPPAKLPEAETPASQDAKIKADKNKKKKAGSGGTILTGDFGLGSANTTTKTLLGS